jgi:hypothetical protein
MKLKLAVAITAIALSTNALATSRYVCHWDTLETLRINEPELSEHFAHGDTSPSCETQCEANPELERCNPKEPTPPVANTVPTMPVWMMGTMAILMGWFAVRKLKKRG